MAEMHPLLSIPEIIDYIMGFANENTLANAAVVNSLWSTICLDKLWYELDSLDPLLCILLPSERAQTDEATVTTDQEVSTISPAWQRFHLYNHRVHILHYHSWQSDEDIPQNVNIGHPANCLLPNLRHLDWLTDCHFQRKLESTSMFLSPKLEVLRLDLARWDTFTPQACSILKRIGSRITNVRWLELSFLGDSYPMHQDLHDATIALILKCHKLKKVALNGRFDTVDFITACRLWEHPALEQIECLHQSEGKRPSSSTMQLEVQGHYPALTELSLHVTCHEMANILQHSSVPAEKLESILFCNSRDADLLSPQSMITLTTAMSRCRSLTHVDLSLSSALQGSSDPLSPTTPFDVFDPLFACRSITTFNICAPNHIGYSSGSFENIVNVWPSLQSLRLVSTLILHGTAGADHNPVFATLVQLAAGLRSLQALELSVDFTARTTTGICIPTAFCKLETFAPGRSYFTTADAQETARLLGMILPQDCRLINNKFGTNDDAWDQIVEFTQKSHSILPPFPGPLDCNSYDD